MDDTHEVTGSLEENISDLNYLKSSTMNDDLPLSPNFNSCYLDLDNLQLNGAQHLYKALHLNIQSLPSKFDQLKNILVTLSNQHLHLDFILLCETFLTDNTVQFFNIPGYQLVYKNRKNKCRGGVAIYIKDNFTFTVREDLSIYQEGEFESLFLEVNSNMNKCIVGEVYRVPNSNIDTSIRYYERIVENLSAYKHNIILGTDQNFDLLKMNSHAKTEDLFNIFHSNGLVPTITKPTRITHTSATLIDNIYISLKGNTIGTSGILLTDISDHLPIFVCLGQQTSKHKKSFINVTKRIFNAGNIQAINDILLNRNWDYLNDLSANEAYNDFAKILEEILDTVAPIQTKTIRGKYLKRDPWMTRGLLKSSQNVTKLYRKHLRCPKSHICHTKYIEYRNLSNRLKRAAKRQYYLGQLHENRHNIKRTWQVLNHTLGRNNDKSNAAQYFKSEDKYLTNPLEIANGFCDFFTQVGPNLTKSMSRSA
jgi:hypothetical protein